MLLDDEPIIGRRRLLHVREDGSFTIESQYDVTDIVERNKELAKDLDGQRFKGDGMHWIGAMPMWLREELRQKNMLPEQDQVAFSRWLNDPDNRVWRLRKAI